MEGCFPRGLVPVGATIDSYPPDTKTRIACLPFRLSVRLVRAGVMCKLQLHQIVDLFACYTATLRRLTRNPVS